MPPEAAIAAMAWSYMDTPAALHTPDAIAGDARGYQAASAATPAARIVAIAKDGSEGTRWPLASDPVDLGRTEGDIRLADDAFISPRHLRFVRRGAEWILQDLDSLNGAYVRLRSATPLADQDLLLLGQQVLRFVAVKEPEQGLAPASEHGVQLFGSPANPRYARLAQRSVEGITRNVYYLQREETVVGREVGDIVFTDDPFLSRRHAMLRRDARGSFTLEDLGSSNGTYLAVRGSASLSDGDFIRVGQHLFRFDVAGDAGAAPGAPAWRGA